MAENPSRAKSSTRWIETKRGILSFAQLAPLLAERVLRVQERIEAGEFASRPVDEGFLCEIHRGFCGDLTPEFAGAWRRISVVVGAHTPPPPQHIALEIRNYVGDLQERLREPVSVHDIPDTLAFAEGRLLSIHPFADFNGRLTRLWIWEFLRRLRLPPVSLVPDPGDNSASYLSALRAADARNYLPLTKIWIERLSDLK